MNIGSKRRSWWQGLFWLSQGHILNLVITQKFTSEVIYLNTLLQPHLLNLPDLLLAPTKGILGIPRSLMTHYKNIPLSSFSHHTSSLCCLDSMFHLTFLVNIPNSPTHWFTFYGLNKQSPLQIHSTLCLMLVTIMLTPGSSPLRAVMPLSIWVPL